MGPVLTNLSWLWLSQWENLGVRQMKEKCWEIDIVDNRAKKSEYHPGEGSAKFWALRLSLAAAEGTVRGRAVPALGILIYTVFHLSFSHLCRQLSVYPCSSSVMVTVPSCWWMGVYSTSIFSMRFQVLALLFCNACYHKRNCYCSRHHFM